jgi:predicted 3-demethylubiquinone-9 3-methyltransferase (glyoxalase superfamily)
MQKISTCLAFNNQAEEAITFYTSIVPNSKILSVSRYAESGRAPKGSLLSARFLLDGLEFMAINGGPTFRFTEGFSIVIRCKTQAEIDRLWDRLSSDGGAEIHCGWVRDRFGVSWQIIPETLEAMMTDEDQARSQRVVQAALKMQKLDIATLQAAYEG